MHYISLCTVAAAALVLGGSPAAALGDDPVPGARGPWWFGLDAGFARVDTDRGPRPNAEDGWTLAFRGGVLVSEEWRVGLELGGIAFEAGDLWDPSKGRALSDVLLLGEYHLSPDGGWFLHGGVGWVSYRDNSAPALSREGDGWGARLGVGHDWRLGSRSSLSLMAAWDQGTIQADAGGDWDYDALRLSIGWSYR